MSYNSSLYDIVHLSFINCQFSRHEQSTTSRIQLLPVALLGEPYQQKVTYPSLPSLKANCQFFMQLRFHGATLKHIGVNYSQIMSPVYSQVSTYLWEKGLFCERNKVRKNDFVCVRGGKEYW